MTRVTRPTRPGPLTTAAPGATTRASRSTYHAWSGNPRTCEGKGRQTALLRRAVVRPYGLGRGRLGPVSLESASDQTTNDPTEARPSIRLLLIRHGSTAHRHPGGMLDRAGYDRWLAAYDEAGISLDRPPPAGLVAEVAGADMVASSDLPRALASAARLAPGRPALASPLLREYPLTLPGRLPWPAPLAVWQALTHALWVRDGLRGTDMTPETSQRVRLAAGWCAELCREAAPAGGTVAVVTHGVFRRMLAG